MCQKIKQTLFYHLLGSKFFKAKLHKLIQSRDALIPTDCNEYISPMDKRHIDFLNRQIYCINKILKK